MSGWLWLMARPHGINHASKVGRDIPTRKLMIGYFEVELVLFTGVGAGL